MGKSAGALLKTVWPLLAAVAILLLLATESIRILSAVRGYVNGESSWAKGQKDALFNLLEYARTGEPDYYQRYVSALTVPLGAMKLRVNVQKVPPDIAEARIGMFQGGAHPDDVDDAMNLILRFQHVSFMAEAISRWHRADEWIVRLRELGWRIDAEVKAGREISAETRAELVKVGAEVTRLNTEFSTVLGEASRALRWVLLAVMVGATSLLVPLGLLLVRRTMVAAAKTREEREHLQKEMQIAAEIQTLILPPRFDSPHFQVRARMLPTHWVGGDYYDVFPANDGCWLAMGDVAGHGLTAGLVALMTQSSLSSLLRQKELGPAQIVAALNRVLFENIRLRMKQDEHVTFSLLRCFDDGRVLFAGAHEDILVWRADTHKCEIVGTRGTWLGAMEDVEPHTLGREFRLNPGDQICLYTDGSVEAMNASKEEFGAERLVASVELAAGLGPEAIVAKVFRDVLAWQATPGDDVTVLAARFGE